MIARTIDPLAPHWAALRQQAEAALPADVWRYLADGDQRSPAWAEYGLMPRPLVDVADGHTRLSLFGQALDHPFIVAPIAYQRLYHPDGECATAAAAIAQGGQMVVSSLASQTLADIAAAANAIAPSHLWFQLYWQGNRAATLRLLRLAESTGARAVFFTVDAPVRPSSLQLPSHIWAMNLEATHATTSTGSVFKDWMTQAPTWDDLAWLRHQTALPLVLKGINHPADAIRAVTLGCDGLVVSSHGGRALPHSVAPLSQLPLVVAAVAGRVPVLFDSGIRSGSDAAIALSLGAAAVLVGRPVIWGLANQGALGAAQAIRWLRDELELCMALMGAGQLNHLSSSAIGTEHDILD